MGINNRSKVTQPQKKIRGAEGPAQIMGVGKQKEPTTNIPNSRYFGKSSTSSSQSNSSIGWQNCLIKKGTCAKIAKGVWEFGKFIGVSFEGAKG